MLFNISHKTIEEKLLSSCSCTDSKRWNSKKEAAFEEAETAAQDIAI